MGSSHKKIEAIFEIIDGLDGLDKEAWMELIVTAEQKREKEIMESVDSDAKEANKVFSTVLPLVRLIRLMIASEEITPFQRTIIVKPLIQELIWLLTPIQTAGVLQSLIYTNFDKGKLQMIPMMIMPQFGPPEREDESRTVV